MLSNKQNSSSKKPLWQKPAANMAYKPALIGALIKRIAEEKQIPPSELERRLGMSDRNIYRLFKAKTMSIKKI